MYKSSTDSLLVITSYTVISSDKHYETVKKALENLKQDQTIVLTFHGVPDLIHPDYSTSVENLKEILELIKEKEYEVVAIKNLLK